MLELSAELLERFRTGTPFVAATVVRVDGSAPRRPGASLVVDAAEAALGNVSGGCVDAAVVQTCQEMLAGDSRTRSVRYGYSDGDGFAVGLTCGGTIDLILRHYDPGAEAQLGTALLDAAQNRPVAVATVVRGPDDHLGRAVVVRPGRPLEGTFGDESLDRAVVVHATALLHAGQTGTVDVGTADGYCREPMTLLVESNTPAPRMLIFGAIDHAAALARIGGFLGYRVTVCDARATFTTPERFPYADEVVVQWPHRYLPAAAARRRPHRSRAEPPALADRTGSRRPYPSGDRFVDRRRDRRGPSRRCRRAIAYRSTDPFPERASSHPQSGATMTVSPVGREIDRVEGRLKVTGAAPYAADYPTAEFPLSNMAYAYVVTSTIAKGRILQMDTAAASDAPGVLAVYHPDNDLRLSTPRPGPLAAQIMAVENYLPLQDREIRYRGQAIAVVVAETFEQARDAAALITTTYEAATPRLSIEANSPGAVPALPPTVGPADVTVLAAGVDSIDAALAASPVVVEAGFHQPIQHHVAMEPHATIAHWTGPDAVTIFTGSQAPIMAPHLVGGRLGLSAEDVRVVCTYTGGGFGSRVRSWNDSILAAGAARALGRPVKLVMAREQVFTMVGHRGQVNHTVRLGASRSGVLNAISHDCDAELPAVGGWPLLPATDTTDALYKTPNLHVRQRFVTLDLPPTWAMRGPNEAPGSFALETAMDELAVATGVDPVELRLRNYATAMPGTGKAFSSKHLDECYRVGARRFGWSVRRAEPRTRTDGQWLIGMGMASTIYPGNRMAVTVRVELRVDDTAVVSTATSDMGTGSLTVLAIIGADRLGIPVRKVTPRLGDSTLPPGAVAAASQATASTVPSVMAAADAAIAELIRLAVTEQSSPWHGLAVADVSYRNGSLHGAGRSMSFGRFLTAVGQQSVVAEKETQLAAEAAAQYEFHSFGAHFCEVRVNRFTMEPRVTRFTTVVDAGRIVNAQTARSQLVGGVIFGIGQALLEENPLDVETGRLAASNMADYMVPVNADIPDIDVHWLDRPDPHVGGLGTRGLGELGTVGTAAAIGNAIYNATGIRVRRTPITLDKLLE